MSARLAFQPLRAYTTQNDRDQLARFNFRPYEVIYGHDHLKHCSTKTGGSDGNVSRIQTYTTVRACPHRGSCILPLIRTERCGSWTATDDCSASIRLPKQSKCGISGARGVVMDRTRSPRAVYVSMGANGLAVVRAKS
jgi:hypothetical protein